MIAATTALAETWRKWRTQTVDEAAWPREAWAALAYAGGCGWGIHQKHGGCGGSAIEFIAAAIELTRGDLITAFVWTQYLAAIQRLDYAPETLQARWLPKLARGEAFTTVGISHLTTSRQHWTTPAVRAIECPAGYRVTGSIPWVTGLTQADMIVAGATLDDGQQILFALDTARPGVDRGEPLPLLALRGSMTGSVELRDVEIERSEIIAGPIEQVLKTIGGGAGSFMTSAVATGHALGTHDALVELALNRADLTPICTQWRESLGLLRADLLQAAEQGPSSQHSAESLRVRSTAAAVQLSQTLLTASKGAGFISGHPAERFAREALFFLVWSCPQTVAGELLRGFTSPTRSVNKSECDANE